VQFLHRCYGKLFRETCLPQVIWWSTRLPSTLHSGIEKGHSMCPFLIHDAQETPFPEISVLTQGRGQDYILNRLDLCEFSLTAAHRQFLALFVSCSPDLGQEVFGTVTVEHQLVLS
jgi:hypothetical protein